MKNKVKILAIIIGIIILFIVVRACNNKVSNVIRDDIDKETQSLEVGDENKIKDWDVKIYNLLIRDIKYEQLPLSKKFITKFKNVEDIIPGKTIGFLAVDSDKFDITRDQDKNICSISAKTGNGFEEIAYQLHYFINDKNELDDIEILDSKKIFDEIGNAVRYDKYNYYLDDPKTVTYKLCFPYSCSNNYKVYITKNFETKFSNYLEKGIVNDDKYLIFGEVYQDKDDKNICYAEFLDVDYTKIYKIAYKLTESGYIDDAIIELFEKKVTEDPEYVKAFYEGYLENR